MTELAEWMEDGDGWEAVPRESALYQFCAEAAGCDGRVFANTKLPELVMCDGADLVLWKIGDVRASIEEAKAIARKRDVSLALEVAKMAAEVAFTAVQEEREICAKIADDARKLWENNGGAAAAAGIAAAIRKRGKETPERGGDFVDPVQGATAPSQPPDFEAHRVPANVCLSCGHKLDSATRIEGEADAPEPGNVTLCLHCGHMMVFADDMSLREPNDEEAYDLAGDPTILRFQEMRGMVMAQKGAPPPWPAKQPDDSEPPSPTAPKND